MNNQLSYYISIEPDFFQELEGEFGVKITGKLAIFPRTVGGNCPPEPLYDIGNEMVRYWTEEIGS